MYIWVGVPEPTKKGTRGKETPSRDRPYFNQSHFNHRSRSVRVVREEDEGLTRVSKLTETVVM